MKTCFFAAPIGKDKESEEIVMDSLKEVLIKFDFNLIRADEYTRLGNITTQIVELLVESELVIVDLTDSNPNVYYELGIRHSTGKEVITITRESINNKSPLPFDINQQRTIFYDIKSDTGIEKFKDDVSKMVKSKLLFPFDVINPVNRLDNVIPLDINNSPLEIAIFKIISSLSRGYIQLQSQDITLKRRLGTYGSYVLKAIAPIIVNDIESKMQKLFGGTIETWGYMNNEVFGSLMGLVTQEFKAISVDDLDFWMTPEGQEYLNYTREKIDTIQIRAERIFAIEDFDKIIKSDIDYVNNVFIDQIHKGFKIRIVDTNRLKHLTNFPKELDFGLFDKFAVSFFRFSDGRAHRVDFSMDENSKYYNYYQKVKRRCEKTGNENDDTLFENEEQFKNWMKKITSPSNI